MEVVTEVVAKLNIDWPTEKREVHRRSKLDQLEFERGRLVRKPPLNADSALKIQVVIPKVMVPDVLKMLHNSATGGHLGVQKLQGKVKDWFY